MNENRSGVWGFQADDEPQQHTLAGAAPPQHRQGFGNAAVAHDEKFGLGLNGLDKDLHGPSAGHTHS